MTAQRQNFGMERGIPIGRPADDDEDGDLGERAPMAWVLVFGGGAPIAWGLDFGGDAPIAWALEVGGGAPMAGEEAFKVVPGDWLGGAPMAGEELFETAPADRIDGAVAAGDGGVKE